MASRVLKAVLGLSDALNQIMRLYGSYIYPTISPCFVEVTTRYTDCVVPFPAYIYPLVLQVIPTLPEIYTYKNQTHLKRTSLCSCLSLRYFNQAEDEDERTWKTEVH